MNGLKYNNSTVFKQRQVKELLSVKNNSSFARMFLTTLFFLCFFFLFSTAFADFFLVSPFEKQVHSADTIELGSISPGETLELIFSNKSGKDFAWNKAEIAKQLPENWKVFDSTPFAETMIVKVIIPSDQEETAQNLKINFLNFKDEKTNDSFNAILFVKKKLITASIVSLQKETKVNEPVDYLLSLSNDSIADHAIRISSTLPKYWFEDKIIVLKKKTSKDSVQEITLAVLPRAYGNKDFSFKISSELTGKEIDSFNARLKVNPTLKGKYAAALYGFPVFTPTLTPYYLINSFLSLLLQ